MQKVAVPLTPVYEEYMRFPLTAVELTERPPCPSPVLILQGPQSPQPVVSITVSDLAVSSVAYMVVGCSSILIWNVYISSYQFRTVIDDSDIVA